MTANMIPDPWEELTPGALGRLAMHHDPDAVAGALLVWETNRYALLALGAWFRYLGNVLVTAAEEVPA